jgi:hypothetical protein
MDPRDNLDPQGGKNKLFPYAKDLYYHPDGILSMTLEIYDDIETRQFSFGFAPQGNLKEFLDMIYGN